MEIKLAADVAEKIESECRQAGRTPEEFVDERLRFYFTMREIDRIRTNLIPLAEAAGFVEDEDFFCEIS